MKLACKKCHKTLTDDLFQLKLKFNSKGYIKNAWENVAPPIEDPEDLYFDDYKMKPGMFFIDRRIPAYNPRQFVHVGNARKKEPIQYTVSEKSILGGVIPPFKRGYGCCNYSMGEPLSCECGTILGSMHLDCYELGLVNLFSSAVDRVYKQ